MVTNKDQRKGGEVLKFVIFIYMFAFSGFANKRLPKKLRYKTLDQIQKEGKVISKSQGKSTKVTFRKKFNPTFEKARQKVSTFQQIPGCISGNIISTNSQQGKVKVYPCGDHSLPEKSYFACFTSNLVEKYNYRVILSCTKFITPEKEYEVSASIKDYYLVDGIKADKVFDGTEESVISSGITTAFQSVIESFKSTESTLNGTINKDNVGNVYVGGIQAGASAANDEFSSRSSRNRVILVVKKDQRVLIEFNQEFFYEL